MSEQSLPPTRPLEPRKTAIVVGASSGIGAAVVRELAHQGYHVAAVARREAKLAELCQGINSASPNGARALSYPHNVTRFEETPELFQRIVTELGGLDLILYTAGVQPAMAPDEYNFEKDAAMVNVNLLGAMAWLGQAALRFERAKAGHVVAISSIAADRGRRLNPGYNASKAGLDTYLEALRNRLSQHGVTVTTIKPGFVDTVLLENAPKTFWVISPDEAAGQIYKAIENKKQAVYIPARWRFVSLVIRNIPSVIFRRLNV
ncbi:MAG: SDR family NAD(P)-dependent oxidoreductase [Chloroflexi bacterium]|nr:SDR family NAD(P)-dependent oxidoreductase [Chloroflexota bacterium]MCI0581007.1 SDR family NAD(P)-dependent oxidoreductase [Chloroflexota bacterium]MCI0646346.1 SDR family NAD(P)-dependent oxidoreductase [Chloroflexota bacterium]MCI0728396.1 SDR family NAD(P)-dependent oxidoreductase [Chloroflexota bacterium]